MAPPRDSAFAVRKTKGTRKSLVQEVEKKKKWSETFSFWIERLSRRGPKPHITPPSTQAARNVFGLPELLGEVFRYVDPENLLTSKQLVNCTWKTTIERSPALQTKLW
jgi:hypothetical protein